MRGNRLGHVARSSYLDRLENGRWPVHLPERFEFRGRGHAQLACPRRPQEAQRPVAGFPSRSPFAKDPYRRTLAVTVDVDPARASVVHVDLSGCLDCKAGGFLAFRFGITPGRGLSVFCPQLVAEIDRRAQQTPEVADRAIGPLQVRPGGFDDIRQPLALLARVAHQSKDEKFRKAKGPEAFEVRWHLPRLSLLKRTREKIPIISTVCHRGIRLPKFVGVRGKHGCPCACRRHRTSLLHWLRFDQTEQRCSMTGQMQVGATKLAFVAFGCDAELSGTANHASRFEIGKCAIQGSTGQQ